MPGLTVTSLVEQTSQRFKESARLDNSNRGELALGGTEIFLFLAEKVVIPIIVSFVGKYLGDTFLGKWNKGDVAKLEARLDEIELNVPTISEQGRNEVIAAATEQLRSFGYSNDAANALSRAIVSDVETALVRSRKP